MKAELCLFRSMGNTSWDLTKEQGDGLQRFLCVLPGTMLPLETSCSFGYKGIRVVLSEEEALIIYKGLVEITSSSMEVRRFMDYNRELEMWLFQTAYQKVAADLYNQTLLSEFPT